MKVDWYGRSTYTSPLTSCLGLSRLSAPDTPWVAMIPHHNYIEDKVNREFSYCYMTVYRQGVQLFPAIGIEKCLAYSAQLW
jgi:hypothetical protein